MEGNHITPLKAIRLKCLDCSCGSAHEVKQCQSISCPLHQFRSGKNPNRKGIGGNGRFGAEKDNSASDSSKIEEQGGQVYAEHNDDS